MWMCASRLGKQTRGCDLIPFCSGSENTWVLRFNIRTVHFRIMWTVLLNVRFFENPPLPSQYHFPPQRWHGSCWHTSRQTLQDNSCSFHNGHIWIKTRTNNNVAHIYICLNDKNPLLQLLVEASNVTYSCPKRLYDQLNWNDRTMNVSPEMQIDPIIIRLYLLKCWVDFDKLPCDVAML